MTHYLNVGHSDVGKNEDKPVLHHGGGKCLLNEGWTDMPPHKVFVVLGE